MASTSYVDGTFGVREIAGRTDSAGTAVPDLPLEQDALINAILTEGFLTSGAFQVAADSPASMNVIVGSGVAKADRYVVETDETGRHPYIVRLDDASVTITLDAADASNPRIDEIWLVVRDPGLSGDAGLLALPRLAYRKGDAAASPSAPGADSAWAASVKLATITVGAGVTSITAGNIADNRATANLHSTLVFALAVRESTEVAGAVALTTSYADIASVTLTIPPSWASWDCEVFAHFVYQNAGTAQDMEALVRIDGTDRQAVRVATNSNPNPLSLGGHREGMTTTGSRTVSLRARETAATSIEASDIYLYARAIRTS